MYGEYLEFFVRDVGIYRFVVDFYVDTEIVSFRVCFFINVIYKYFDVIVYCFGVFREVVFIREISIILIIFKWF